MEDTVTPSINGALMPRFINQRVRLVCELDAVGDGSTFEGRTADKVDIKILHDQRSGLPQTKYVEFIGTVVDGTTLKEESNTNWGDAFDLGMHNEAVNLMHNNKYAFMFHRAPVS